MSKPVLTKVRDESGVNLLVEASFSGVAVRPLLERIRRSTASQICVRTLEVDCENSCVHKPSDRFDSRDFQIISLVVAAANI